MKENHLLKMEMVWNTRFKDLKNLLKKPKKGMQWEYEWMPIFGIVIAVSTLLYILFNLITGQATTERLVWHFIILLVTIGYSFIINHLTMKHNTYVIKKGDYKIKISKKLAKKLKEAEFQAYKKKSAKAGEKQK